ncbi:hypothetical protein SO802_023260 [Lithocarpus litseifolius]|uniref:Uncharacterized protein n=1 Tax=Lithocarpus litseifolius TaxID=425828 RepID=A0AAW2C8B6_9ROSI
MPVDTTWGVLPPSVEFFGEDFQKTKLEDRSWAKLVSLETIHWHCDGPEPFEEVIRNEKQVRVQMDDAKRRAIIKQQAAARKKGSQTGGTDTPKLPVSKRKPVQETDRHTKKTKVTTETVVGLEAEAKKIVPVKHGKGKGLMMGGQVPNVEKPPVLLREDSKYALEKLSSIITSDDYEDLGNHATEAMGETGLFNLAQAVVMMKGLMDRCVHNKMALGCVRAKAAETEDELAQFKVWRVVIEKKLVMSEQERVELEKQTEVLQKVLGDKEKEIISVKDQLHQAKEDAIKEFHDSEVYLTKLGSTLADGFDDALRQVKASHPELDLSHVSIDEAQTQTSVLPAASDSTDRLFDEDQDVKGDGNRDDEAETAVQV